MSKASYLAFDFETGGVDPSKNPILTGYFCALDDKLNIIGDLELAIKPSAPFDLVEAGALKVNGIDMAKHVEDPATVTREAASAQLVSFIEKYSDKKSKMKPLGHNIAFDIDFSRQLVPREKWGNLVHYGFLCTFSLSTMLKDAGLIPQSLGKLETLVDYFQIKKGKAHTAKDDVLMTVELYGKMIQMVKGSSGGDSVSLDLLSMLEK